MSKEAIKASKSYREALSLIGDYGASNTYGYWYPTGRVYQRSDQSYICYAYLNSASDGVVAVYARAVYANQGDYAGDSLYFEYLVHPELSPWRELLPHLDLEVVRHPTSGHITGVIVWNTGVNRYFMMQFLKGFRQVIERRSGTKIFSRGAAPFFNKDKRGYTAEEETYLHDLFMVSNMFEGSGEQLTLGWGGEHKNFHGFPNEKIAAKTIHSFNRVLSDTYKQRSNFVNQNLPGYTWMQLNDQIEFGKYSKRIKEIISISKDVVGHFMKTPVIVSASTFAVSSLIDNASRIIDDLNIRPQSVRPDVEEQRVERRRKVA